MWFLLILLRLLSSTFDTEVVRSLRTVVKSRRGRPEKRRKLLAVNKVPTIVRIFFEFVNSTFNVCLFKCLGVTRVELLKSVRGVTSLSCFGRGAQWSGSSEDYQRGPVERGWSPICDGTEEGRIDLKRTQKYNIFTFVGNICVRQTHEDV